MPPSPATILLIDHAGHDGSALAQLLAGLGFEAVCASLEEALPLATGPTVAMVLVDASSSGADAALAQLHSLHAAGASPLVAIAPAADGGDFTTSAYQAGAIDVLASPVSPLALRAKAAYFCQVQQASAARRHHEDILHDTQAQLDATLVSAELATWNWDLKADCVVGDPVLARLFNVSDEQASGSPVATYLSAVHPDDIPHTRAAIAAAIENGLPYDVGYRVRSADGQLRHVIARGQLRRDAAGQPERLRGVIIDVTRAKQAEAELRESEERYRTLFDSVDDGVCIIEVLYDQHGVANDYRFIEINPAFVQHTGLADAVGKTIQELAPGHEAHWFALYGKVAQTGEPVRIVDEAKALNRWYDVYATRVGGPGSNKVAVLFTDITARVLADAELRRLAADLASADRRKTEFLATLAHELRNPLAPIRSGLQVLRMASADPAHARRAHEIMERQLDHLIALVDDLLDVARITRGQVELKSEWIELADIVRSAVETSMPLIEAAQHALVLELPQQPLALYADPTRVRQVISNLLNNAAKYTPRGGRITLTARADGGFADIAVADNGVGIGAESLGEVFEMFNQVGRDRHRSGGGLGIGLSLVRSLTELHGGSVTAASAGLGQGSVFTVRLPLASPAAAPATAATREGSGAGGPARRILVVDDNIDAAATLGELLGLIGHTVQIANSGSAAVTQAGSFLPDVVFLDIGMPGMDGYDTARALRSDARHADVLLVALTGWGGAEDRARTSAAGFDRHLTKPVTLEALASVLGQGSL